MLNAGNPTQAAADARQLGLLKDVPSTDGNWAVDVYGRRSRSRWPRPSNRKLRSNGSSTRRFTSCHPPSGGKSNRIWTLPARSASGESWGPTTPTSTRANPFHAPKR